MQNKAEERVYAGFFVRLAAYLIDMVIVGVALMVVRLPIWIATLISPENILVRDFIFQYSIKDLLVYVLSAMYFILLTYKTGATIGKKVLNLRVVSEEDRELTLFEVIYRETVGRFLSALIVHAGYFMIGVQSEKQGLHDMLADTRVVYNHKKQEPVELEEIVETEIIDDVEKENSI